MLDLVRLIVVNMFRNCVAVFIASLFFAVPAKSQVYVGGTLVADVTYSPDNNPYIVTQNLIVNKGVTLTIQPGVEMLFEVGTSIINEGTLVAKGTTDHKISFLPKSLLAFPGQWNGIVFYYSKTIFGPDSTYSSGSVLSHAIFKNASYSVTLASNTSILIENVEISLSSFGINILKSGHNIIRNCSFQQNNFGIFLASGFDNPENIISGNTISECSDVGIFINSSSIQSNHNIIRENLISSCSIGLHIGNYVNNGSSYNTIERNTFIGNMDAVKLFQHSNTLRQNYFIKNHNGIICWQSNNNTISENLFSKNTLNALTLTAGSSFNTISHNSMNYNFGGVWVKPDSLRSSLFNSFLYNTLYDNSGFSFQVLNAPQGPVQFNNIGRNPLNNSFINMSDSTLHAEYNFWGTISEVAIDSIIFDAIDQPQHGEVMYKPVLEQIFTAAPVPPTDKVIKQRIGADIVVSWKYDTIADISGYKVHYGKSNNINFENTIYTGLTQQLNMGNIPVEDTVCVTTYDSQADGLYDQAEGHESDYTIALPAPYAGPDTAICYNSVYTVIHATAFDSDSLKWQSSGDGFFNFNHLLRPIYNPGPQDYANGYVYIYLDDESVNSKYSDEALITFHDAPEVFAGNDSTIFSDSSLTIQSAYALGYDYLKWTTSGDGFFDSDTLLNPVYIPGAGDRQAGSVILSIEGFSACGSATDEMVLTFNPGFSIRGRVHAGDHLALNSTISIFLDTQNGIQPLRSGVMAVDGTFELEALLAGGYYLYALPDKSESPGYLPTYYYNDIKWENAYRLDLTGNTYDVDIKLALNDFQLPQGTGSMHGEIVTLPGSTQKCGDVTVLLYDKLLKNVFDWQLVSNGSNFNFSYLPFGEYILVGEKAGKQSFQSEIIVLSPLTPQQDDIQMICTPAGYKFLLPDSEIQKPEANSVKLFPNPVSDKLYISGLDKSGDYTFRIFNAQGIMYVFYLKHSGNELNSINLTGLIPGIYSVEILKEENCYLRYRLIKY